MGCGLNHQLNSSKTITNSNTNISTGYPSSIDDNPVNDSIIGYPNHDGVNKQEETFPDKIFIPNMKDNYGIVIGQLIQSDNKPYIPPRLYLGKLLQANEEDMPSLISFSTENNPEASLAKNGSFIFENVDPGQYVLIIWSPMNTVPIIDNETNSELIVYVEEGELRDLGIIYIE